MKICLAAEAHEAELVELNTYFQKLCMSSQILSTSIVNTTFSYMVKRLDTVTTYGSISMFNVGYALAPAWPLFAALDDIV